MISPAPASEPNRTSASRKVCGLPSSAAASTLREFGAIAITRQGCSRLALFATARSCSSNVSFVEISSVSTRPRAASPRSSCNSSIFAEISRVSVFFMVMITASSNGVHRGPAFQRLPEGPTFRNDTVAAGQAWTRTLRSDRGSASSIPLRV